MPTNLKLHSYNCDNTQQLNSCDFVFLVHLLASYILVIVILIYEIILKLFTARRPRLSYHQALV